jgi:hypothetical protein
MEKSSYWTNVKWLLVALVSYVCHAFGGPNVRVDVDAQGDGALLIMQAYRACLRNTPGVVVVSSGQPADALIQVTSIIATIQAQEFGYVWAMVVIDPTTRAELDGPEVVSTGRTYQQILRATEQMVLNIDRDVFASLRNQTNN